MGKRVDVENLRGASDVARRLGVSRQRVHQLMRDDPTFPAPVTTIDRTHIWDMAEVDKWAARAEVQDRRAKHRPRNV
ncbi:MAG: AlpA family phage regulatory protein [Ilumatobacteraceae bacterium]